MNAEQFKQASQLYAGIEEGEHYLERLTKISSAAQDVSNPKDYGFVVMFGVRWELEVAIPIIDALIERVTNKLKEIQKDFENL